VPDPTLGAALEVFESSVADLRAAVDGLEPDVLNRRLAGEDTNSIAVIATHAMHSTRAWLSLAVGAEPPERDRPAEFVAVAADDRELASLIETMADDCRALLSGGTFRPERTGLAPWRPGPEAGEPVTSAWALIHAFSHLREHVAQALLSRQLLDR
jgi:hypothetical protein